MGKTVEDMFRRRMREVRQLRGWTQGDLATRLGELGYPVHRTKIARIESGEAGEPLGAPLGLVVMIARALGVSLLSLIHGTNPSAAVELGDETWRVGDLNAVARGIRTFEIGDEIGEEEAPPLTFEDLEAMEERLEAGMRPIRPIIKRVADLSGEVTRRAGTDSIRETLAARPELGGMSLEQVIAYLDREAQR
jgi:transcriptional regulator with XRE-family HTH domain